MELVDPSADEEGVDEEGVSVGVCVGVEQEYRAWVFLTI
jgi:hypothetical protein